MPELRWGITPVIPDFPITLHLSEHSTLNQRIGMEPHRCDICGNIIGCEKGTYYCTSRKNYEAIKKPNVTKCENTMRRAA